MTPPHKEIKRYRRFAGWDYSRGASLFITISTSPRRAVFGQVAGGEMRLSPLGKEALLSLELMPRYNPGLLIFGRVVMPNHIHFNCHIEAGLKEPLKFLGNAIRRFKNHLTSFARQIRPNAVWPSGLPRTSNLCQADLGGRVNIGGAVNIGGRVDLGEAANLGGSVDLGGAVDIGEAANLGGRVDPDGRAVLDLTFTWQQGYHDRLLPSEPIIKATERYIAYNPAKWELMKNRPAALQIKEPLDSPRLDPSEYWKGVGNTTLLDENNKIVSLRISRKLSESQLRDVEKRVNSAIEKGFTVLSGFISPGEKRIRDLCCRNGKAKFIRMLPCMIPLAYKPESAYVEAFLENRYLEIAKGNDEVEFGRAACLDLNDEIVKIATAGEGLALYWRAEGLQRLG